MIHYVCKWCKKKFKDKKHSDRKFCCRAHYWEWMKGKGTGIIVTPEECERRRIRMMGENNPMWRGGDSDSERRNSAYKNWRIEVFTRDSFICQDCGYYNGDGTVRRDLNAHHIVPWIESIELRYAVENGITLCVPCHIKEHSKHATHLT